MNDIALVICHHPLPVEAPEIRSVFSSVAVSYVQERHGIFDHSQKKSSCNEKIARKSECYSAVLVYALINYIDGIDQEFIRLERSTAYRSHDLCYLSDLSDLFERCSWDLEHTLLYTWYLVELSAALAVGHSFLGPIFLASPKKLTITVLITAVVHVGPFLFRGA